MEKEKSISILRTGHSQFPHLLPWPGLKQAACAGEHSCLLTWQCCGPGSLGAGRAPTGLLGQGASRGVGAGGTGWCRAPRTLQAREGWRPHSSEASEGLVAATSHPGLPARPGGSSGGREGGRAPCPAPGFSEGCKGQWEAGGAPLLLGEGRAALAPPFTPLLPRS